jgi:uncharacterized protein
MPEFTNPFISMTPDRKLTDSELVRAIRLDLSSEQEAVHLYQSQADATDNILAKKVLTDIADEERVHTGEFLRLIQILLRSEESLLAEGAEEVNIMAGEINSVHTDITEESAPKTGKSIPTVGDLKRQ